ncbi:SCO family protein [Sneathiella aquimaris]|jgi:protein SCO1/2|uniref:SCO family protein n=1 Tax=Sneathiella aquimaris TaxID=2599305 RepID=UPI00146CC01F|nr:SCO family protein [Sneathiella aquimaris]
MKIQYFIPAMIYSLAFALQASANHPGSNLDDVMSEKETFFQAINEPDAPSFELINAQGELKKLADYEDKIVVLNFIFSNCAGVCPLHSARIADIQEKINSTPMKRLVQFISITTDPGNDVGSTLEEYGQTHGLDPINWEFLTKKADDPEDFTRKLAMEYGVKFQPEEAGQQMHGVVTFIIDRGSRFAAKFHGLKFKPINLILYVNGLSHQEKKQKQSFLVRWWEVIYYYFIH